MFRTISRKLSAARFLVIGAMILALGWAGSAAIANDTGTLKLKVQRCLGATWVAGGQVNVVIQRPGVGQVDSASGTTSSSGYIEFTFTTLSNGDEAHVTITPSGSSSDSSHTYYWVKDADRANGEWDLGIQADSACDDGWYSTGVFLCMYH